MAIVSIEGALVDIKVVKIIGSDDVGRIRYAQSALRHSI